MSAMASQITSLMIVYSTVYSGADQRKLQSSASLAFVRGTYRWPVNSPHKGQVMRKMFLLDDVIMKHIASREPLQWRHLSVPEPQVTSRSTICTSVRQFDETNNEITNHKIVALLSLCDGNHQWPVDPTDKGKKNEILPCHNAKILYSLFPFLWIKCDGAETVFNQ